MEINFKKLTKTMTIPTKAYDTDACFDLYCDIPKETYKTINEKGDTTNKKGICIMPNSSVIVPTGFATEIPEGYYCPIYARSGLGINKNVRLSNCTGVIDSSYRGEWKVALFNDSQHVQIIHHGDRIAQFAVLPVIECTLNEVKKLNDTDRGEGGFGSTGN